MTRRTVASGGLTAIGYDKCWNDPDFRMQSMFAIDELCPQAANRQVRGAEAHVNVAQLQAAHDAFVDESEDAANFVAE